MNFPTNRLLIVFLFQLMVGFSMAQNQKDPAFWLDQVNTIHANPDYYWNEKLEKVTAIHDQFLESNDKNGIYAKIIHRMGDYYRIVGEFPEAISLMQEAIAINKSNAEHAEEFYLSFTYCNIGIAYQELGLQEKAESYYDSALFLHRKFPAETFPPAYISFDRKTVYTFNKGEYQRTVDLLDYAFGSISGLDGTIEKNLLLIKKARALLELGEFEQAEKIYLESIGLFESGQYSGEYPAFAYNSYGIYLARSEMPEEAEQYFDKSIQIYLGLGALGNVLNVLDELYFTWAKKDDEKALTYLNRARKYLEPYPDSKENLVTLNHMGRTLMHLDRFDEALQLQQDALRFAVDDFKSTDYFHNPSLPQIQQTSSFMEIAMILKNKGETLLRKYQHNQGNGNELDHALSTLKLSDKVIDLMRWDQQAENTKAYWRASTKSLYEMALEAAFNLNDQQAAFYFMEKSRAVMLNDQLSEMGALKFLTEKDLYQERQLKTEALSMKNLMLKAENGDAAYQKASVDWFEAQSRYESFIKELESKYPNYYQYKYDTTVLSLSRLQGSLLSESQAYLSYFVGEESIYLFYAAKGQSGFEKLASTDLKDKADQLLGLVSDRNKLNSDFKNFQKMSFQLYADLIPVGLKGYDRLIVSPDEFFIPFELLMTDSTSKNAYLLQSHAISYTYSAGFLQKHRKSSKKHKVFGLAPVEYKAELQQASLLGADLSLKRINKFFPSNHFVTYEKATKQNFLDNLSQYSIVQLYSHAVADTEGVEPRLYFYDESMPLSELQLLGDMSTQLIVLAACNTGVGKNISGEGIFSLARGFAAAGIPSSLTTLWEVENKATYELTERFYQYLSEGFPSDVALQKAKISFLENSDGQSLPYYWSGQLLVGAADVMLPEKSTRSILVVFLMSVIFFGLILLYLKKKTKNRQS